MLYKLFSSKARVELLKLFLFNPEASFYQRQIALRTAQPIRGVQREVDRLQKLGVIEKVTQGNRIYYKASQACTIFEELSGILFKTVGIADLLKKKLSGDGNIKIAFIYGKHAQNEASFVSDIDLFVIGAISSRQISALLSAVKRDLKREINCAVFPVDEFKNKMNNGNGFIADVLQEKRIFIIGSENELKTVIK